MGGESFSLIGSPWSSAEAVACPPSADSNPTRNSVAELLRSASGLDGELIEAGSWIKRSVKFHMRKLTNDHFGGSPHDATIRYMAANAIRTFATKCDVKMGAIASEGSNE